MIYSRRTVIVSAAALAACGPQVGDEPPPAPAGAVVEQPSAPPPGAPDDPRPRAYALIGQAAPAFSLPKLGGGEATLADYGGRVLVLYFGGLWCPDCMADGANVHRLTELIATDPRIAFLHIHTRNRFGRFGPNERDRANANVYDAAESARALNGYFAEKGYAYPVAFDASRDWAHESYKIEWSPSYLIVDKGGVIRHWRTELGADGPAQFFAAAQALA